jgi:saccharopine dehydrogenase-like NADP-dependent oxidoreductase
MKVVVLGAGQIGRAICRLLSMNAEFDVRVVDLSEEALAQAAPFAKETMRLPDASGASLRLAASGREAVVNALPWQFARVAAEAAVDMGAHYFDLTEDVEATTAIKAVARGARTLLMPQCGLAPGFIGMAGRALAEGMERVESLRLRVGALPQRPSNALKYNITWSVDGLVNEYCRPCPAVRDGKPTLLEPLEGLERLSVDGVEYEAFNTSGGLGDLESGLLGLAENIDYKTMRYPGHRDLMAFLLKDLRLGEDQAAARALLARAIPATEEDLVVVFAAARGLAGGRLVERTHARVVMAKKIAGSTMTAIQLTTASSICASLDLLREGKGPSSGFASQNQTRLDDFLANRFGQLWETEGARAA